MPYISNLNADGMITLVAWQVARPPVSAQKSSRIGGRISAPN